MSCCIVFLFLLSLSIILFFLNFYISVTICWTLSSISLYVFVFLSLFLHILCFLLCFCPAILSYCITFNVFFTLIRLSFCVYKTYLTIFFPIRSFLSWRDANISVSPIASTRREAKRKREKSLATQISQQRELPWRGEKQTFLSITEHRRTVCWCCSATSQQPTKTGPDRIWLAGWLAG